MFRLGAGFYVVITAAASHPDGSPIAGRAAARVSVADPSRSRLTRQQACLCRRRWRGVLPTDSLDVRDLVAGRDDEQRRVGAHRFVRADRNVDLLGAAHVATLAYRDHGVVAGDRRQGRDPIALFLGGPIDPRPPVRSSRGRRPREDAVAALESLDAPSRCGASYLEEAIACVDSRVDIRMSILR
jgi:hypothetical protein